MAQDEALLIVPVGIEISFSLLFFKKRYTLLIVPVGIEMATARPATVLHTPFNRTSRN